MRPAALLAAISVWTLVEGAALAQATPDDDDIGRKPATPVPPPPPPEPVDDDIGVVRTAPAPAAPPPPPPAPVPPRPSPALPKPAPAVVLPPVQGLFRHTAVLVSIDEAFPIVSLGSTTPLSGLNALQIGESTSFGPVTTTPRLPNVDVVLGRFTVGGTIATTARFGTDGEEANDGVRSNPSFFGVSLRGGVVLPLSERLALWPHLGATHMRGLGTTQYASQTNADVDARLVYAIDDAAALTFGVAAALPIATERTRQTQFDGTFTGAGQPIPYSDRDATVRLSASVGLLARLSPGDVPERDAANEDARAPMPNGTILLGVDRLLDVLSYEHATVRRDARPGAAPSPERLLHVARVGLFDTRGVLPHAPRLSADVVVGRVFTVGGSAGIGMTKTTSMSTLSPASSAPTALAWSIAPRAGALVPLWSRVSVWPRVGLTYAESRTTRKDTGDVGTHHVSLDGDAFLVVRGTSRFFVALGPSVSIPLFGATYEIVQPFGSDKAESRHADLQILNLGLGGMLGLSL